MSYYVPAVGDRVVIFESYPERKTADWIPAVVLQIELSHVLLELTGQKDSYGDPVRRWFEKAKISTNHPYVVIVPDTQQLFGPSK